MVLPESRTSTDWPSIHTGRSEDECWWISEWCSQLAMVSGLEPRGIAQVCLAWACRGALERKWVEKRAFMLGQEVAADIPTASILILTVCCLLRSRVAKAHSRVSTSLVGV